MEVTAKVLQDVEFREGKKGYLPEDVDDFLEQVAKGVDALHERIRQLSDRLQRAEQAASEVGSSEETLRKTLILAQRTADLAVQEARDQAARILAGAEQQAQAMLADAEEQGRRAYEDALAEGRSQLANLEAARQAAQGDVDSLSRWFEEHRGRVLAALGEARAHVEGAAPTSPAPQTRPVEGVSRPEPPRPESGPPRVGGLSPISAGESEAVRATEHGPEGRFERSEVRAERSADLLPPPPNRPSEMDRGGLDQPTLAVDERAMDSFFDDNNFADDRRLGGRLRRRNTL
jgi:DivIVA domain-containing protein